MQAPILTSATQGTEAREEVVEDDVRVGRAAGAGWGREEAGAVEAREEGAPDPGRTARCAVNAA